MCSVPTVLWGTKHRRHKSDDIRSGLAPLLLEKVLYSSVSRKTDFVSEVCENGPLRLYNLQYYQA